MNPVIVTVALPAAGLAVGPLLAWISLRLPGAEPGARVRLRVAAFALAAVAVGAWAALAMPSPVAAIATAVLGWQLLLIAVVDFEHFWLPDRLTAPLGFSGLAAAFLIGRTAPLDAVIGAAVGFAALWLLAFAYRHVRGREGLGGGDPFLLAAAGAWVGWIGLPSVLLWASAAGLSLVLAGRLTGRALGASDRLAFGVFLAIGVWMTWLFGPLGLGV